MTASTARCGRRRATRTRWPTASGPSTETGRPTGSSHRHETPCWPRSIGGCSTQPARRTRLRWLVDNGGSPCPDAEDNSLAGLVVRGEPFPTGHCHPPAHPGCRCLLVPRASVESPGDALPETDMPRGDRRSAPARAAPRPGRVILVVAVVALFIFVTTLRSIASFYTDYLWFESVGPVGRLARRARHEDRARRRLHRPVLRAAVGEPLDRRPHGAASSVPPAPRRSSSSATTS